jgi:hypothetical protein
MTPPLVSPIQFWIDLKNNKLLIEQSALAPYKNRACNRSFLQFVKQSYERDDFAKLTL